MSPAAALVTCSRCGAGVELPANYCDMCGARIARRAPADLRPTPEPKVEGREHPPVPLGRPVPVERRDAPRVDPDAARRSLASAYGTIKDIERTIDSAEAWASEGSLARRVFDWFTSGQRVRGEAADLHRTLDLARKEARTAAALDPDAAIETDDGPLSVRALSALIERVAGTIELFAGKPRVAIERYQSSLKTLETRDAYLDMAFAYERIGRPDEALRAYERCSALVPVGGSDVFAEDEAERLRSKTIMGGWFVGSWGILVALAYLAALSAGSITLFPLAGKVALAASGSGLAIYLGANFRRRGSPGAGARRP